MESDVFASPDGDGLDVGAEIQEGCLDGSTAHKESVATVDDAMTVSYDDEGVRVLVELVCEGEGVHVHILGKRDQGSQRMSALLECAKAAREALRTTCTATLSTVNLLAKGLEELLASDAQIRNFGPGWLPSERGPLLAYPAWLAGEWQVAGVRLEGVVFPLGQRFVNRLTPGVTKASLIAALADVGASQDRAVTYRERYVATADGRSAAPDRPFNIQQQVDAFLGLPGSVQSVASADPARLAITFTTPRRDKSVQAADRRRAELFVNAHGSAAPTSDRFVASEGFRQVTQANRAGQVGDYQVVREYSRQADGSVAVRQRVAAFLQPQDALYFETGGRAVALYDHTYVLQPSAQGTPTDP
ncbi:hypothetical protein WJX81_004567 [Elliptochloris bilobata]|uniref:DUF6816 domain-containing protein n=1 Tax=Elliptochloris bilobata TaxID=381761 RepID=A0AAW1RIL3_9CHLO